MVLNNLVLILVAAWVLVKATELVINNLNLLAKETSYAKFGLAAVLVAASTSFPELFVGITSSLNGVPNLSIGNVIGSNIANPTLIIGLAAVVSGSIAIRGEYMKRDLAYAFMVGAIPLILLSDGRINRLEGLSLIVGYVLYVRHVLRKQKKAKVEEHSRKVRGRFWESIGLSADGETKKILLRLVFGLAVILVSAETVVRSGITLADRVGIPVLLVGIFIVAVGTSLPELSLWAREAIRREGAFVFGNLMGSMMTNSLLVIGVTATIAPVEIRSVESYFIATIAYVILFWLFWWLTRSKNRLYRWEGLVLVGGYALFVLVEFLKENGFGLSGVVERMWEFATKLI